MHSRQSNGSTMAAVDPHTGYPLAEGITHTCSDTVHTLNWAMVPRTLHAQHGAAANRLAAWASLARVIQ